MERTLESVLRETRVIAVVGAHVDPGKPAFFVPDYMAARGYRVLPVNPTFVGRRQWGQPFRATLAELDEPADLINVFRRSAAVPGHLPEILALDPRPAAVWLQLGVRHDPTAERLRAAGIAVIQDRCLMTDHADFAGRGAVSPLR